MSRRTGVAALSTMAVLTWALVGCSTDDDDGQPTGPSPSATATADATGGETESEYIPASADGPAQNVPRPTKPALADEESVEGAQAFLDYLADARSYAWQTGDTSLVREITAPACDFCIEEYDAIDEHYRDGGWATGGREVLEILDTTLPRDEYGFPAPRVRSTFDGITLWDKSQQIIEELDPINSADHVSIMHLNYMEGAWEYVHATPVGRD